jgi:hypothetical protein
MKYTVLENAAVEASTGLHEIDAEIDQIEAAKVSLRAKRESLETVGRQLFTVLSALSEEQTAEEAGESGALTGAPAPEPAALADAQPEAGLAPVLEPETEAAPLVEMEAHSAPLPQEEEPAFSPLATIADAPAEEHQAFAEAAPEIQAEAHSEDHAEAQPEPREHEEWENCTPVGVGADADNSKAPSFKDLLSQSKPYSLRNDGWPSCKPVAQRALRDLL